MKRIHLTLTLLLLVVISSFAQKTNPLKESYNYKRALEAMQNEEDNSTIMQYLQKELEEHPKNGYAYMLQGVVYLDEQQVGQSLEALNKSVQLLKKDKESLKDAYRLRSKIQDELENDTEALADLDRALKLDPKDMDVLCDRAEFFYQRDRYEEADRDYDAMIRIEPGNTLGYMGKGRNALEQERYDEALKMFDYCVKLSPDFARAYAFRGETYMGMKKYDEAGNDLISAIDKGQDSRAFILMQDFKQPALNTLIAKVKVQMAKNRNDDYWPYYLGVLYEGDKQYRKAIDAYKTSFKIEPDPSVAIRIGNCYAELGDYDHAIEYTDKAIELDSTETSFAAQRGQYYYDKGDNKTALQIYDKLVEADPENATLYYMRGFIRDNSGDIDGAIDDYTLCIVLQPDWETPYRERADLYTQQGKQAEAEADYRKAIALDSTGVDIGTAFCYLGVGETEKIRPCIDTLLADPDHSGGDLYNIACIYSLMNRPDSALHYLRLALENGYTELAHIRLDSDMRNIRDTEAFRQLLSEYEEQIRLRNEDADEEGRGSGEEAVSEVPFTKENGVYKVKCEVNSLPLHFIFDTGASSVSISMVEATFMMKNGYLTKDDVVGSQYFQDANGNVSEGTVINLRRVHLGDCDLENVKASVVRNQRAPILLGQSVLSRLGKIEIDNEARVLRIRYHK